MSAFAFCRLKAAWQLTAQLLSLCNAAQANFESLLQARAAVPHVASERQQSPDCVEKGGFERRSA